MDRNQFLQSHMCDMWHVEIGDMHDGWGHKGRIGSGPGIASASLKLKKIRWTTHSSVTLLYQACGQREEKIVLLLRMLEPAGRDRLR